nr:hypothetical protein [Tanacetum cinerariifolium]
MLAIFHNMSEESVKVFMDDLSIFGSSFDHFINNLDKMLQRFKDAHIVLNWEKCHFIVKEEFVLGHKVSEACLEVDKAKIDIISKLPPPTNINALRNLFKKQDAKPRLICWILLLQEFEIEIKDRNGTENVAADHLSIIKKEETSDDSEVNDNFPGETLMEINTEDDSWFADFANYLVRDIIPKGMTYQQQNKFFSNIKHYFWEEPYLLKVCSDAHQYTTLSNPQGVIYEDKLKRKRFMPADELHKFSDDTLILVRDTLDQMLHEFHLWYNTTIWRRLWTILDQQRTRIMIKDINQKLLDRRRSLENFVGGRDYGEDLRLL